MSHVAQATEAPAPSLDDNVSIQPAQSQGSVSTAAQVPDASTANITNSGHSVAGDLPDQQTEDGQGEPAELEVDDTELEDSALGSDTESITQSIDSTVYNFREEFGRTYHGYKDGKYYLPNDESESDRLDFMHVAFNLTYGKKLFLSPVEKLENALDIGTGTGIWAIDLADEYPQCQVIGTDLSPSQPDFVPPNVRFMVDDAEDTWVFSKQFDLIHARLMAGSFADWPNFFREAYKNLEPGGWLELQEFEMPVSSQDGTHEGTNIQKWGELLCESSKILGRPMGAEVCAMFEQQMRDAGFVDVQRRNFIWPTNPWPKDPLMKELGLRTLINCTDGMEGFCLALYTRALGWKKEEVDVFVAMVKKDFKDRKIHAFIPMPVFLGRKPHPHETTSAFS